MHVRCVEFKEGAVELLRAGPAMTSRLCLEPGGCYFAPLCCLWVRVGIIIAPITSSENVIIPIFLPQILLSMDFAPVLSDVVPHNFGPHWQLTSCSTTFWPMSDFVPHDIEPQNFAGLTDVLPQYIVPLGYCPAPPHDVLPRGGGPHPENLKFPPRHFFVFCGPLASLANFSHLENCKQCGHGP